MHSSNQRDEYEKPVELAWQSNKTGTKATIVTPD
jgi:hypothetical protein